MSEGLKTPRADKVKAEAARDHQVLLILVALLGSGALIAILMGDRIGASVALVFLLGTIGLHFWYNRKRRLQALTADLAEYNKLQNSN